MNILALNWQDLKNPMSGGAEVHLEELLRRIAAKGHQVTLFCSNYEGGLPEENVEGVKIIRAGSRYNFNLIAPFHLRRLIKQNSYDLFLEDINKIPFYTPFYQNLPMIVIIPHLFSTAIFQEVNFVLGSYIYFAERPLTRVYRKKQFCVISESTASDIIERGVPREQVSVIHCGIDQSLYNNDAGYKKYDYPSILYLGRIKKYKSVQHLIEAFKIVKSDLPDAKLAIVGAGDYIDELKKLVVDLKLSDDIEFPGFVSKEKKVEYLCRSHVMAYPSLKEGWGLTNIEANSCGTTVVAARTPGLRDSVKHEYSGLLYEYGEIEKMADLLKKLLTDDEKRTKLEQGGLEWAKQFNWDLAADKFLELCFEVSGKND
ncbi:MAG: glycosyltransferase family 4 protein [candidate division Zixibacteria bacterium]|nr:glycosyltransferase family 4 protein [candidate division Zixibacteria bacterium]